MGSDFGCPSAPSTGKGQSTEEPLAGLSLPLASGSKEKALQIPGEGTRELIILRAKAQAAACFKMGGGNSLPSLEACFLLCPSNPGPPSCLQESFRTFCPLPLSRFQIKLNEATLFFVLKGMNSWSCRRKDSPHFHSQSLSAERSLGPHRFLLKGRTKPCLGARKGHQCWGKHQVQPGKLLEPCGQWDSPQAQHNILHIRMLQKSRKDCCQSQAPSCLVNGTRMSEGREENTHRNKGVSKDFYTPDRSLACIRLNTQLL